MNRLIRFLRTRWEEVVIWGLVINIMAWSVTTGRLLVIVITLASIAFVILLLYMLVERVGRRRRNKLIGENTAFTVPRRGIIYTVGKQTDTIAFSMENQKPVFVGLLCSTVSETCAAELIDRFKLVKEETARLRIVNPFEVREIHHLTNFLIDWMKEKGLDNKEIAVDVTGGMTTMSVAAFSAAEERQVDSQYVRSQYDDQNRVIKGTMEGMFVSHFPDAQAKKITTTRRLRATHPAK